MSTLEQVLTGVREHPGVEHVLLLGRDGLLIQHLGGAAGLDTETTSAVVPEIASACEQLGAAGSLGEFATAVIEYDGHVAIILSLSADLLLAVLLHDDVGFATLLRNLRSRREYFASLI